MNKKNSFETLKNLCIEEYKKDEKSYITDSSYFLRSCFAYAAGVFKYQETAKNAKPTFTEVYDFIHKEIFEPIYFPNKNPKS